MVQVAIIGGGLGGLVLALNLHKRNISTAIYESRSEDDIHGGSIALAPNALRILDRIGAYEALRVRGFIYERIYFANGSGQEMGYVFHGSSELYNFPALRIKRSILREELVRIVKREGVPIYWNKKCVRIVSETAATTTQTNGSATAEFSDGEKVEADFVIGADGIHSRIRSFIAPDVGDPTFTGLTGITGTIHADELGDLQEKARLHVPCMLFGANGSIGILPSSFDGKEIEWFANLETEDRSREEWTKFGNDGQWMKDLILQRFLYGDKIDHSPEMVKQLMLKTRPEVLTNWPFYTLPHVERWTSPHKRVILIGDAAHAIPPTGGQGAAMAFEDADTLSYVLARAYSPDFNQATDLSDLITKWEHHRQDRVGKITVFTSQSGRMRRPSTYVYEQVAKEWIIWAALKIRGPQAGGEWIFSYNPEDVLAAISS
ncbi:salicylate hydroxylase [Talaromyces pinophilus]|uniref:Salicylate hydroxylase n=1 Tax=Talaromyces pinophilus TaxID=128442 RepID=A0A6V8HEB8_TALPI|nr:salicylate hydroxylase [Talaromyces pinophilus]